MGLWAVYVSERCEMIDKKALQQAKDAIEQFAPKMTGREWLARFEDELRISDINVNGETLNAILEAAKRASGVSDD